MDVMDREQTIEFLHRHVKTEMLMKHLFSVEASMRGYAHKFGEDENRWGVAGLLHDFDWRGPRRKFTRDFEHWGVEPSLSMRLGNLDITSAILRTEQMYESR